MNDATRELGAALGVAVLGSVASSHYGAALDKLAVGLPASARSTARASIAGALQVASRLPGRAGTRLADGAQHAFVGGIQLAVTAGAILAVVAAVIVMRYLPHQLAPEGALHGPVEAIEDVAELGLAGIPTAFGDEERSA